MKSITPEQLKKLWTAARGAGFDRDAVHGMLPKGKLSTRDLTLIEAAQLIDAIENQKSPDYATKPDFHGRSKRRPKGVYAIASDAQRNTIEGFRVELGWSEEAFTDWLSKRHFADGRDYTKYQSSGDAVAVIELLKGVLERTRAAAKRKEQHAITQEK